MYFVRFSREVEGDTPDWFIHLGIYGYKFNCLKNFVKWQQSKRELESKLEQLRALDNGVMIKALPSKSLFHLGVDTKKDLEEANEIAKKFFSSNHSLKENNSLKLNYAADYFVSCNSEKDLFLIYDFSKKKK